MATLCRRNWGETSVTHLSHRHGSDHEMIVKGPLTFGLPTPWLVNGGHGASLRHHKVHTCAIPARGGEVVELRDEEQRARGAGRRLHTAGMGQNG
eukprot:COSAG01_NODE_1585_length_9810_cov_8.980435_3_plen_95_part_00